QILQQPANPRARLGTICCCIRWQRRLALFRHGKHQPQNGADHGLKTSVKPVTGSIRSVANERGVKDINGLLSPTLSSRGGEGEPKFVRVMSLVCRFGVCSRLLLQGS